MACRAPHPDQRRQESCGTLIGHLPMPVRFDALVRRAPEEPDGYVYVPCPRRTCGAWHRFEIIAPDSLAPTHGR